jgi:hypothetical protein
LQAWGAFDEQSVVVFGTENDMATHFCPSAVGHAMCGRP